MLLTSPSSLLQLPPLKKYVNLSTNFTNGSSPIHLLKKPFSSLSISNPSSSSPSTSTTTLSPSFPIFPVIRALKTVTGRVVCTTNNKTVAVEVTRLAVHPKYKRRVRIKKKFQVHDPDNQFKIGDVVELQKCKPISKMKSFLAVPIIPRNTVRKNPLKKKEELGLPLESQQLTLESQQQTGSEETQS